MGTKDYRAQWRIDEERDRAQRPRLVLADDDQELRTLLVAALRADGYDVIEVQDGSQLISCLATQLLCERDGQPIDLVISDLRMPGCSGLDVLAGLRFSNRLTPFILLTAFGDAQTHREARRLGAACVFDKPFDVDDLRTIVCNLVS